MRLLLLLTMIASPALADGRCEKKLGFWARFKAKVSQWQVEEQRLQEAHLQVSRLYSERYFLQERLEKARQKANGRGSLRKRFIFERAVLMETLRKLQQDPGTDDALYSRYDGALMLADLRLHKIDLEDAEESYELAALESELAYADLYHAGAVRDLEELKMNKNLAVYIEMEERAQEQVAPQARHYEAEKKLREKRLMRFQEASREATKRTESDSVFKELFELYGLDYLPIVNENGELTSREDIERFQKRMLREQQERFYEQRRRGGGMGVATGG